jgi:3-hydroxyacyl-CoA dehydrogenase/enoyl-CoA hydratase/3-hydroxybutyryl-CoA epimerase
VVCRSSPGFLVTRVLFFYLNEAVRRWETGVSTLTIDGAMREFGWPMGPLRLLDEVGLDVGDFIFGELQHYFPQRFVRSHATTRLLKAGLRGRKGGTGRGFYRYEGRSEQVNDIETTALGRSPVETVASAEPREIVHSLMRVMAGEAERCLSEGVVKSADEVDFALSRGAGFPAARGGLLQWAQSGRAGLSPPT